MLPHEMEQNRIGAWHPASWQTRQASHQVEYRDQHQLHEALRAVAALPPLVFAGEVIDLKKQIARAANGEAFVLQGGDCVERFSDCTESVITNKLKILLQMSVILAHGARRPVVRVGRIGGQYVKPRSQPTEVVDGEEILTYRGDGIHGFSPTKEARTPDPDRLLRTYYHSAATLNYIRAMIDGGFADLHHPYTWNLHRIENSSRWTEYRNTVEQILDAVHFMESFGSVNPERLARIAFYTSHEALHLPYEQALTRYQPQLGQHVNLGAHMLWLGDRTRDIDGAHVEYVRGIANPIGIKLGPTARPDDVAALVGVLNPDNERGRMTLITRLGRDGVATTLPPLIEAIRRSGLEVAWSCDPMHGNTIVRLGRKTRNFEDVLEELRATFEGHAACSSRLAGVHFELTGDDVTECLGGSSALAAADLERNYQTFCDPRLNYDQSLEMAFLIAAFLRAQRAPVLAHPPSADASTMT